MRLLVDENLSYRVAEQLSRAGHDAVHVSEVGLNDTDDDVIFPWALREERVVITQTQISRRCSHSARPRGRQ